VPGPLLAWRGYVAPLATLGMGKSVQFPAPSATVTRQGGQVRLDLHGSDGVGGRALMVSGGLKGVSIGAVHVAGGNGSVMILCGTPDCASAHLVLDFSGAVPGSVLLAEQRYGLPASTAKIARARPDWAVPSGQGDMSYVAQDIALPPD
jgi:hypothetical protein